MKVNLVMALIREVSSRHGDVPSAYPKAQTEEKFEIHLQISQGMNISRDRIDELGARCTKELLLKLQRNLYGLKQAGILWNDYYEKHCLIWVNPLFHRHRCFRPH